jgi:hypothetical protein
VKNIFQRLRQWQRQRTLLIKEEAVYDTVFFEKGEFEGYKSHLPRIDYLKLLHPRKAECREELDKVRKIVAETDEPAKQIAMLLDVRNWRPHIIGCVAALYVKDQAVVVEALWRAFDRASWASTQLAATLSLVDTDFVPHALQRLRCGVPVHDPFNVMNETDTVERIEDAEGFMALWGILKEVHREDSLESSALLALRQRMESLTRKPSAIIAVSWREEVEAVLQDQQTEIPNLKPV